MIKSGAEDIRLPAGSVDLVFTSPPYFNVELYGEGEASQSHLRYPEPSWWESQFLARLCANAFEALRPATLSPATLSPSHPHPCPCPHPLTLSPSPLTLTPTLALALALPLRCTNAF